MLSDDSSSSSDDNPLMRMMAKSQKKEKKRAKLLDEQKTPVKYEAQKVQPTNVMLLKNASRMQNF